MSTTAPPTQDRAGSIPAVGMPGPHVTPSRARRVLGGLGPKQVGAVYVWIVIIAFFAIYKTSTFATGTTVSQILDNGALTALAGLALLIPLATRTFDLSIGYVMSLSGVVCAHFVAAGVPIVPSVLLGLGAALLVGMINAGVVVLMGIDSFIGTLATGSIVSAFITMVTNDQDITSVKLTGAFSWIGQNEVFGVEMPVVYMVIVAVVLWVLMEYTTLGRRLYSVGFNADAAKLAGVRVDRLRIGSLLTSSLLAGVAGIALCATIGSGSASAGPPYLLPAFAVAFLGATQVRPGRFNASGTIIAVLLLTTGTTGLSLALAPAWAADLFTGVVLIAALGLTGAERHRLTNRLSRLRDRRPGRPSATTEAGETP